MPAPCATELSMSSPTCADTSELFIKMLLWKVSMADDPCDFVPFSSLRVAFILSIKCFD